MSHAEEKIKELGYELPPFTKPQASYVPAVKTGNLVFISGQGATNKGKEVKTGHIGSELTIEEGKSCAVICALNALTALKSVIGDLDKVKRIVKVLGFVNSAPGFDKQPIVMNGFSDFMEQVFGERGRHARTAISCNELPYGTPVEVEMIVEVTE
ncbi:MAG: RidA family protein [Clostridiaceae bacterium]